MKRRPLPLHALDWVLLGGVVVAGALFLSIPLYLAMCMLAKLFR